MPRAVVLFCALLLATGCRSEPPPSKQYTLEGQIVAVAPAEHTVTIKHHDIKDFMPGMTMPFPVKDDALLAGKGPGDLVTATLVVGETEAYLSSLQRTGHAPLDAPPPPPVVPVLKEGAEVADAPFLDESNRPRSMRDWQGHRVALTFIYTRCPVPDFCPLMDRHFVALQEAVRQRQDLADVHLLTVTLDPDYDRPSILKAHAARLRADPAVWSFLTGDAEAMKTFAGQFGIYSEPDRDDPSQVIHSLRTAVIGADGRLVRITGGNEWTPPDILAQLTASPAPTH